MFKRKGKNIAKSKFIVLWILQICFIFSNSLFDRTQSLKQSDLVQQNLQGLAKVVTEPFGVSTEVTQHFTRKLAHLTELFILGALLFVLIVYKNAIP